MRRAEFRKVRHGAGGAYYATEAAGLRWLSVAGGPPIPRVYSVGDAALVLERIVDSHATNAAAESFGRALVTMHASGAAAFGAGPPDAPATGWIADVPMPFGEFESFGPMYAQLRIRPYLRLCREADLFDAGAYGVFESLCERLGDDDEALVGPAEPVARLHGDLWSGNLLWAPDRDGNASVWLIDPAAYGGHRETDLAMLALFGTPLLDRILAAYSEVAPLAHGWEQRVPLHQVYPLLVHAILFGGGYRSQALRAAERALAAAN